MMKEIPPNKKEFIGCSIIIENCTDPTWIGKKGIIVDETKHLFIIEIKNCIKKIEKKTAIFQINGSEGIIRINGSKINYRPEERIKKAR